VQRRAKRTAGVRRALFVVCARIVVVMIGLHGLSRPGRR